jgi:hypothetical protein
VVTVFLKTLKVQSQSEAISDKVMQFDQAPDADHALTGAAIRMQTEASGGELDPTKLNCPLNYLR